jgi:hypothetical protein
VNKLITVEYGLSCSILFVTVFGLVIDAMFVVKLQWFGG